MDFDRVINRFGSHSVKWDMMEAAYGVPAQDGIAMWVADMDFQPPQCVQDAIAKMGETGVYGYYGDETDYRNAICWWMHRGFSPHMGWSMAPQCVWMPIPNQGMGWFCSPLSITPLPA